MFKIIFVCLGNICRSPMAEFAMKKMLKEHGLENRFYITSAATSREEEGNPVYPGAAAKLRQNGIDCRGKYSTVLTLNDLKENDLVIVMDQSNVRSVQRLALSAGQEFLGLVNEKLHLLLEYAGREGSIADPWYTGDFEQTWMDVNQGCKGLINYVLGNGLC